MKDWKTILAGVDDDYLIGISNKGIVKRAYKDMEGEAAAVIATGDTIEVSVGGEKVIIDEPLGESSCSCPSRSICRHIVQAILTAKQAQQTQQAAAAGEDSTAQEEKKEDGIEKLLQEIREYPQKTLFKTLGKRGMSALIQQLQQKAEPKITSSSIVTVELPDQEYTVKLLYPLEYSTCTCHKKELCVHKAAAILWCQLKEGVIAKENLFTEQNNHPEHDLSEVHEVAVQMKEFLEELLDTGLSRSSQDVLEYLERLAIIGHNAGLARFEGYFRTLLNSYEQYFRRKSSFRTELLMEQTARLYRRVEQLLKAEDAQTIALYAGEFRVQYNAIGALDLTAVAMEHFSSQTGYEGDTVYFLEENTKKWYTYTSARPVFYEQGRRSRYIEKAQTPWGINVSLENLPEYRIHLNGAKCDERRRLSASQDTGGELVSRRRLSRSLFAGSFYEDFYKLYSEKMDGHGRAFLSEQDEEQGIQAGSYVLVLIKPYSFQKAEFSETEQRLTMALFDGNGRKLFVEMPYSKKEARSIRYLEKLSQKHSPCFFGKVYLREGRLYMNPIAVILEKEFEDE